MASEISDIYLEVPVLDQNKVFPTKECKNMACWYTASFMALLFRMGVTGTANTLHIDTLKRLYDNKGLGNNDDADLAKECGLEHSPSDKVIETRDRTGYVKALSSLGPLVMSLPKHVICVRGCITSLTGQTEIAFNDPAGGLIKKLEIGEFEKIIEWSFPIHFRRTKFEPPSVFKIGPNMNPYASKY